MAVALNPQIRSFCSTTKDFMHLEWINKQEKVINLYLWIILSEGNKDIVECLTREESSNLPWVCEVNSCGVRVLLQVNGGRRWIPRGKSECS